jgi:hypothetical protein
MIATTASANWARPPNGKSQGRKRLLGKAKAAPAIASGSRINQ